MSSRATLERQATAPDHAAWPLERVLFALAGSMTLLTVALAAFVSPWFLLLGVLVGVNQWLFVLVGACPASLILRRAFSLTSLVYPDPPRAGDAPLAGTCPAAVRPSDRTSAITSR